VFGSKWEAAAPVVQILVWGGVALALSMLGNAFFLGAGRPHLASHVSVLRLMLLAGLVYPCIRQYGLGGAALAVSVSAAGAALYQLALMLKIVGPSLSEVTETVKTGVLGSLLFGSAAAAVHPAPSVGFLVLMTLATLTYALFLYRSLRSHFEWPRNMAWARSLRERFTF
jgi:O-antigen/teichoic acid export membrane protein